MFLKFVTVKLNRKEENVSMRAFKHVSSLIVLVFFIETSKKEIVSWTVLGSKRKLFQKAFAYE